MGSGAKVYWPDVLQHTNWNKHWASPFCIYYDSLSLSLRFNGHFPREPGLASV